MVERRRTWREVATAKVPERAGCVWTPILDYLTPGRTYLLEVPATAPAPGEPQKWTPESAGGECTADGAPEVDRSEALLVPGAAVGALIAKIGGGAADLAPDKDKIAVFAVGRYCVFTVDAAKTGSLYLGVNDTPKAAVQARGQVTVKLSVAV
jgi:hypothetical protein